MPTSSRKYSLVKLIYPTRKSSKVWKLFAATVPGCALQIHRDNQDRGHSRGTGHVDTWLQRKHDVKVFGEPSWRHLAEAVAARSGGDNLRLTTEIARSHPLNTVG